MEEIVGTIVKSDKTVIRVSRSEFKGNKYLNIREWFTKDKQTWYPGKGTSFVVNTAEDIKKLTELINILEKAESILTQPQEALV